MFPAISAAMADGWAQVGGWLMHTSAMSPLLIPFKMVYLASEFPWEVCFGYLFFSAAETIRKQTGRIFFLITMQRLEFEIKHCQGVGQTVVSCVPVWGFRLEVDQRAEMEVGLNCE